MCDCFSYNGNFGSVPQRIMDPMLYFKWGSHVEPVAVDECVADEVEALWKAGIWTLNSCCGHNNPERRGIIIEECVGHKADEARGIVKPGTPILYWKLGEHLGGSKA